MSSTQLGDSSSALLIRESQEVVTKMGEVIQRPGYFDIRVMIPDNGNFFLP